MFHVNWFFWQVASSEISYASDVRPDTLDFMQLVSLSDKVTGSAPPFGLLFNFHYVFIPFKILIIEIFNPCVREGWVVLILYMALSNQKMLQELKKLVQQVSDHSVILIEHHSMHCIILLFWIRLFNPLSMHIVVVFYMSLWDSCSNYIIVKHN